MQGMIAGAMSAEPTDEVLIRAARGGDRAAFSQLMARTRELVFAYALARLGERDEAEDVAQETFVRAYLSLHRLRRPGGWQAWLLQITRNLCSDTLRRKRVRRTEPIDPNWLSGEPSPETHYLSVERRRELAAAVAALPEALRTPLLMRFGSGCSRQEIAMALGVPESTVIGRLARGMGVLRRKMKEVQE
jgi:RNA polymerase sigma-70 factor (ECF subfamily)